MAVTIEQDRDQVKRAFALQTKADIDSIRILEATLACKARAEDVQFPLSFLLKHEAESAELTRGKLSVSVIFGFKAVTKEEAPVEAVRITCRLQADYDLASEYEPSAEEVEAFRESNAIFNCWPYFREFVQSSLTRMNYPPLTVPFLRLVPKMPKEAADSEVDKVLGPGETIEQAAAIRRTPRKKRGTKTR